MTPGPGQSNYRLDSDHSIEMAGTGYRYVIACDGKPVVKKRTAGLDTWLVYRNDRVAQRALYEVQLEMPEAELVDLHA